MEQISVNTDIFCLVLKNRATALINFAKVLIVSELLIFLPAVEQGGKFVFVL